MSVLKPLGGTLLVEIETRAVAAMGLDAEGKTASGFLIAEPEQQGIPNMGTVFAVADGAIFPHVGDRVVFSADGTEGFKWEGHKLFKLKDEQIVGVFK